MLSIAPVASGVGAAAYYAGDNYYCDAQLKEHSEWTGRGAEALGLGGPVDQKLFEAVLEGRLPNGSVIPDGTRGVHRPGVDLTFSAPKSVSLLAYLGGDARLLEAHRAAVRSTLAWAEKQYAETRVTDSLGRQVLVNSGNLVVALFQHDTSRLLDPQAHIHAVIANATAAPDGQWRALAERALWQGKTTIASVYNASFRQAVERLGYETEASGRHGQFEISGVSREVIAAFSQRRAEIVETAKGLAHQTPAAMAAVTLRTRGAKPEAVDREQLHAEWRERARAIGFDPKPMVKAAQREAGRGSEGWQRLVAGIRGITAQARALVERLGLIDPAHPNDALVPEQPGRMSPADYAAAHAVAAGARHLGEREGVGTAVEAAERAMTYTLNGQVATLTDGESNRTTYEYDGHDRAVKMRYPVATKGANASSTTDYEQLSLDANGNVTQRRLRDGTLIGYAYDALDRVTLKDLPSPEADVSYGWDLLGRLTTATQGGHVVSFAHDALGRQTSASGPLGTTSYQYDAAGRRTRVSWPDGFFVTYEHLVTGEVSALRENGVVPVVTITYDVLSRRSQLTRSNGTATTYSYDGASRLSQLVQDPIGTASDLTLGFGYNPASQIASATRSNPAYAWTAHYNVTRGYTANGLNQYSLSGSVAIGHDARGNLASAGNLYYGYTAENRLKQLSDFAQNPTGAPVATLAYDPLGRLMETVAASTTRFGYDGAAMIAEYNSANQLLRRYVYGPGVDEPLLWLEYDVPGGGTYSRRFLHADERGSIVGLSDGVRAS